MANEPDFSVTEAAVMLGVTDKTIRSWIRQGLPTEAKGRRGGGQEHRVTMKAVMDWLLDRQQQRLTGKSAQRLEDLKVRRLEVATREAELSLAAREGKLLPATEVEETWGRHIARVRSRLLSIPSKAAGLVLGVRDTKAIQRTLESEIHEALGELGDAGAAAPDAAPVAAAAAADRKPVGRRRAAPQRRKQPRAREVEDGA